MSRDCAMRAGKIAAKKTVFIPRDTLFTYSSTAKRKRTQTSVNRTDSSNDILVGQAGRSTCTCAQAPPRSQSRPERSHSSQHGPIDTKERERKQRSSESRVDAQASTGIQEMWEKGITFTMFSLNLITYTIVSIKIAIINFNMTRSSLSKIFIFMWFVCAVNAHTGRKSALEPPPQYNPQAKPTGRPNQPTSVITVTTSDSHVTSFHLKGKITTNLNVADLLIIYDIQPFHDQFQTIKREISKLPSTILYPERMHVINREVSETERLIKVHDHLLRELDRRGIWGPFAIISGLFAGGISIAAMAEAHSVKNRISDLEAESSRIFHAHSLAINDHAQQLSNITSNQAFMVKQISRSSSLLYAIRVKDEIYEFQAKVKDRNRAISDMITGKFPMSTFSDQLASAASRLLKKVHSKGFSTIEDLKPMDFTKLPFSVSHHGDSKYVLHIHVPIFRSPKN